MEDDYPRVAEEKFLFGDLLSWTEEEGLAVKKVKCDHADDCIMDCEHRVEHDSMNICTQSYAFCTMKNTCGQLKRLYVKCVEVNNG